MSENQDQKSKKLWWCMSKKQPWPKKEEIYLKNVCLKKIRKSYN